MDELARLYVDHVVTLHYVPKYTMTDRDPNFTSHLSWSLHAMMGTRLNFSTSHLASSAHPSKD
ncbi:hypothetical protein LINPERPRIM_LOCUS6772 [Linum perenne]